MSLVRSRDAFLLVPPHPIRESETRFSGELFH